ERKYAQMYEKTPCDIMACRGEYLRAALGSERCVLINWNDFGVSSAVRARKPVSQENDEHTFSIKVDKGRSFGIGKYCLVSRRHSEASQVT
ncbi:hypothetical protein AVEN_90837-1, partial [Araneus ventricosus]